MKIMPLFGGGIASDNFAVTRQRRVNCYYENRPDGDKTEVAIYGTPGLTLNFTASGNEVVRGMMGRFGLLFYVSGNTFHVIDQAGSEIDSHTLYTAYPPVSMTHDANQVFLVDGNWGYVYNYKNQSWTEISWSGFPKRPKTCTFVSGYFVVEMAGTQQFFVSGLNDPLTWDGLSFASASAYPDTILAVDNLIGNLILFSTAHCEFWQNVGSTPQPFQPVLSATNELGLAALWSRAHVASTLIYLARNPNGTAQVVQINGYQAQVISTPDLENIINGFDIYNDARALSYVVNGHPMYQISFPTGNRSFLFDCSTGLWSEVQTGVSASWSTRHIANFATVWNGQQIASSWKDGKVYTIDHNAYTDDGETTLREVVTRHVMQDFNVIGLSELYLDMETGVGLSTGQGSNPIVTLEVSKDNGHTWSLPRQLSLGAVGKYNSRVIARRLGSGRDFVFRIRMTDPVKFVITNGAVSAEIRKQ